MKGLFEGSSYMSYGRNLVVGTHVPESVGRRTGLQAPLDEIMWRITTRFNKVETRMVSGQEESGSKSKTKGQRK